MMTGTSMVSFTSDHSPAGHSHLFCTLVCYFCLSFEVVAHHNTVIILHLGLTGCYTYFIHLHVKSICVALCQQSQERSNIEKVKISVKKSLVNPENLSFASSSSQRLAGYLNVNWQNCELPKQIRRTFI